MRWILVEAMTFLKNFTIISYLSSMRLHLWYIIKILKCDNIIVKSLIYLISPQHFIWIKIDIVLGILDPHGTATVSLEASHPYYHERPSIGYKDIHKILPFLTPDTPSGSVKFDLLQAEINTRPHLLGFPSPCPKFFNCSDVIEPNFLTEVIKVTPVSLAPPCSRHYMMHFTATITPWWQWCGVWVASCYHGGVGIICALMPDIQ